MSTRVKLKRSNTTGSVPISSQLEIGELALNMPDARLFCKNADNAIFELGSGRRATTANTAPVSPTPLEGDLWYDTTTGAKALKAYVSSAWEAIPAQKLSASRTFSITGLVTGSASFDGTANCTIAATLDPTIVIADGSGNITQNAATATKLATARTINGVSFDGSANITIASTSPYALTVGTYLAFASGSSYDGSVARQIVTNATAANTASTLVARDGSGNIAVGALTATGVTTNGNATVTGTLGVTGTLTLANALGTARHWTSADTDIDALISGAQTGVFFTAASSHFTVGLSSAANTDGFQVISKGAGGGSYTTLCFEVKADGTTTLGTVTTGVWSGTSIAATKGGTGQSSWTTGDLLYASAENTLSKLAGNTTTTKKFLSQTGNGSASAAPVWSAVAKADVGLANVENTALSTWAGTSNITTLGTIATGTWSGTAIAVAKGGTGATTASGGFDALSPMASLGDIVYGGSLGTGTRLAGNTTTTKKFLSQTGNGSASAAPAWSTVSASDVGLGSVENTALSTWVGSANITTLGTIATGTWSGTAIGATKGGTAQTTWTTGDILYASAANTLSKLTGNITTTKKFLAQTGSGSASAAPLWSTLSKGDVGLGNVENTALSTWAGTSNITTLGTIATGTWSATTIAVNKGGTGATTLTGYVKGSGTAALTASATIPETDIADGSVLARLAANETIAGAWTFNDSITVAADKTISFTNSTEVKINWYSTLHQTGVQASTLYHRFTNNYALYCGGIHSDTALDPGAAGTLVSSATVSSVTNYVPSFDTVTTSGSDYGRTITCTQNGTASGTRGLQVFCNFEDIDIETSKSIFGAVFDGNWNEDGILSSATVYNITNIVTSGSAGAITYTVTAVGHTFVGGDVVSIRDTTPGTISGAVVVATVATDTFTFVAPTALTWTSGGTATKWHGYSTIVYGSYSRAYPGPSGSPSVSSIVDLAYGAYNTVPFRQYSHVNKAYGSYNILDIDGLSTSCSLATATKNHIKCSPTSNKGTWIDVGVLCDNYLAVNARSHVNEIYAVRNIIEQTNAQTYSYIGTAYGVYNKFHVNDADGTWNTVYGFYNSFGAGMTEPVKWGIYSSGEDYNYLSGQLFVSHTASVDSSTSTAKVQIHADANYNPLALFRWASIAGAGAGASIFMCRSRSTTTGTHSLVSGGDLLGGLYIEGSKDSSSFGRAAHIGFYAEGTPSASSMPGKIVFGTTPAASLTVSDRMTIDSTGQVNVLTTTDATSATTGAVITAGGLGVAKAIFAGTSILSVSPTAGVGYSTGAGGSVTQATNKSTGVTLNKVCGTITMNGAALGADTTVSFTLSNTAIAATDTLIINHTSGGTAGAYLINAQVGAGTASINVRNITAGSLSEAIVIRFAILKAVTS